MICGKINECKLDFNNAKKTLNDKKGGSSKYSIENKSKNIFYIIDFEKDIYKNQKNDRKCDFGLLTDKSVYFIELKGSDVNKGIKQLLETIIETENCFNKLNLKSRLIVSRFPKPNLLKKRKEYKDLVKKVGSTKEVIISQNIFKEVI